MTAPAAGSPPATGAAPLPRVEVAAAAPELGEDDVLAVPVGARGALPDWPTAAARPPIDPEFLAGALADTGNGGKPGGITNVPVPGRRPRSVVAVGVGDATLVRGGTGFAVRTLLRWLEAGAPVDVPARVVDQVP